MLIDRRQSLPNLLGISYTIKQGMVMDKKQAAKNQASPIDAIIIHLGNAMDRLEARMIRLNNGLLAISKGL